MSAAGVAAGSRANDGQEGDEQSSANLHSLAADMELSPVLPTNELENDAVAHIEDTSERQVSGGGDDAAASSAAGAMPPQAASWHRAHHRL